jgi:hypothetical protein
MKKALLVFIGSLLLLAGCKKFPEDHAWFHLRSAKSRLCPGFLAFYKHNKEWGYTSIFNKRTNSLCQPVYYGLSFGKNGTGGGDLSYNGNISVGFFTLWKLEDENLILSNATGYTAVFKIARLDFHELVFENDTLRFEFHYPRK